MIVSFPVSFKCEVAAKYLVHSCSEVWLALSRRLRRRDELLWVDELLRVVMKKPKTANAFVCVLAWTKWTSPAYFFPFLKNETSNWKTSTIKFLRLHFVFTSWPVIFAPMKMKIDEFVRSVETTTLKSWRIGRLIDQRSRDRMTVINKSKRLI